MTFWNRPRSPEQLRSLPDEPLCREVSHGNQEAFLVLFDRYWGQVFRLANAVIRDEAEAEDLAQSLFLEVHASMLRFDEQNGLFRGLLFRYASLLSKLAEDPARTYPEIVIKSLTEPWSGAG